MSAQPVAPIPMIDPTLADAIARIAAAAELTDTQRTHWTCSLRMAAKFLGRTVEEIPARWIAIRQEVGDLHHDGLGIEAKTLANHKSNIKAALSWFCGNAGVPKRGAPLSNRWGSLIENVPKGFDRVRLLPFARYCSGRGIEPEAANDLVLDQFMIYRAEHTRLKIGLGTRRALVRSWNTCLDSMPVWPQIRLAEPPLPRKGLRIEDLPVRLQNDIEHYIAGLTTMRRTSRGRRLRPSKPSTLRTRRAELVAFIGKAVECGFPLHTLTSLAAVLRPEVVEVVLDRYWAENGDSPSVYVIDMAWKLLALARGLDHFDAARLERLDEIRAELEQHRQPGLTEKNRTVIRTVLVAWMKSGVP